MKLDGSDPLGSQSGEVTEDVGSVIRQEGIILNTCGRFATDEGDGNEHRCLCGDMRLSTTFGAVPLVITDLPVCHCAQAVFHRLMKGLARFHITLQIHPIHSGPKFSSSVNEKGLVCHDSPMFVYTLLYVYTF